MKKAFLSIPVISLALLFFHPDAYASVTARQVQDMTIATLGSRASVMDDKYVAGDFDGDGHSDLAIMVNVDDARSDIRSRPVRLLGLDGKPVDAGKFGEHCAGLLIIFNHAAVGDKKARSASVPVLTYACYSGLHIIPKGQPLPSESGREGPHRMGDGIVLDMETGASLLFYWDGKTFRSFEMRGGD